MDHIDAIEILRRTGASPEYLSRVDDPLTIDSYFSKGLPKPSSCGMGMEAWPNMARYLGCPEGADCRSWWHSHRPGFITQFEENYGRRIDTPWAPPEPGSEITDTDLASRLAILESSSEQEMKERMLALEPEALHLGTFDKFVKGETVPRVDVVRAARYVLDREPREDRLPFLIAVERRSSEWLNRTKFWHYVNAFPPTEQLAKRALAVSSDPHLSREVAGPVLAVLNRTEHRAPLTRLLELADPLCLGGWTNSCDDLAKQIARHPDPPLELLMKLTIRGDSDNYLPGQRRYKPGAEAIDKEVRAAFVRSPTRAAPLLNHYLEPVHD